MTELLEAALRYARRGWKLIPIQHGSKAPHSSLAPHGLHDATDDAEIIGSWFAREPNLDAIAVAAQASGLLALDIDTPGAHGKDGYSTLRALERRHGALPETFSVKTPTGGAHYYFRHPGGTLPGSAGEGIDVKANGYVLLPPSLHPNGRCYELDAGGVDDVAELPQTWLSAFTRPVRPSGDVPTGTLATLPAHDTLARTAASMASKGLPLEAITTALEATAHAFNAEPGRTRQIEAKEVGAIVSSAVAKYGSANGTTSQAAHSPNGVPSANLLDLRTIRFERVRWFETNLIPLAEFTLVNGDGGIGKTTFILDLIARASAGRPMPTGLCHGRPLRCLIVAEEDRHGLLRARLEVAGAAFENIWLLESIGSEREFAMFPTHVETLRRTIVDNAFDFVMIDAFLNHFDDDLNSSRPQDMRKVCRPLSSVSHDTGAAMLGIRHFGKAAATASTRGLGSVEARNVCRSELAVGPHPDDDGLCVVVPSKANLAENRSATLAYRLRPEPITDDDGEPTTIARVEWESSPPQISADELTNRPEEGEKSKIDAAAEWLREYLGTDEHRASDVMAAGAKAHHVPATLYRARRKVGVVSEQRGYPAKAFWFLKGTSFITGFQERKSDNPDKPGAPEAVDEVIL